MRGGERLIKLPTPPPYPPLISALSVANIQAERWRDGIEASHTTLDLKGHLFIQINLPTQTQFWRKSEYCANKILPMVYLSANSVHKGHIEYMVEALCMLIYVTTGPFIPFFLPTFSFFSAILHTSYLSFFLHEQNFWRIKFTPKKRVNYDKIHRTLPIFCVITAKYTVNCQFFALNL